MSLLIVWHTIAMAIASARVGASAIPSLFDPIQARHNWGFFAPTVELGGQFRYVVEDAAGQRHTLCPGRELAGSQLMRS